MKRKLFMTILLYCFFCFGFVSTAYAQNGPSTEDGAIYFLSRSDSESFFIYVDNKITNDETKGITYDLSTNTLTVNNFKGKYYLIIDNMGEDFKLNVLGVNDFVGIYIAGSSYRTNITFIGDGKLILNTEKDEENPIPILSLDRVKIIIEDTVSLELYAANNENSSLPSILVACDGMTGEDDKDSSIVFKGRNNYEVKSQQKVADEGTELVKGFAIIPEEIEVFKIAEKDSKKYAYSVDEDNKVIIYLNELNEDPYSHKWYIGNRETDIDNKTTYNDSSAATSAGFTLTEGKAYRGYYRYNFLLQKDENDKQYGLIYGATYDDVAPNGIPFEITDKTITIDSVEYKYLEYSDIDPQDLERVPKYTYLDEYVFYVEGNSLILDGKNNNVVNPKTGVMNYLPIFLILIVGMVYGLFLLNKKNKFKRSI